MREGEEVSGRERAEEKEGFAEEDGVGVSSDPYCEMQRERGLGRGDEREMGFPLSPLTQSFNFFFLKWFPFYSFAPAFCKIPLWPNFKV